MRLQAFAAHRDEQSFCFALSEKRDDGEQGDLPGIRLFFPSATEFEVESGVREETGTFRDVKRRAETWNRTLVSEISLLRHNRYTTAS